MPCWILHNVSSTKDMLTNLEGHVLFDVTSMDDYGLLSGRQLDDMLAGRKGRSSVLQAPPRRLCFVEAIE